jgi:hypothetical protein
LERALSQDPDDLLAKIYLGLTLARSDDRRRGLQEIQAGLKGLYDWLEYLTYNTYFARYWDPSREIRAQVEKDLTMIAGQNLDWQKLIADVEWIAKRTEEEVDRARQDEQLDLRDRFPRSGVFFGFGF